MPAMIEVDAVGAILQPAADTFAFLLAHPAELAAFHAWMLAAGRITAPYTPAMMRQDLAVIAAAAGRYLGA